MDKAFLLGSLFLRLSSIYGGATHADLMGQKRRKLRKHKPEDYEDLLEKAPWKVDLIRSGEGANKKAA